MKLVVCLLAAVVGVPWFLSHSTLPGERPADPAVGVGGVAQAGQLAVIEALVAEHGCWTGEAPEAGLVPGHVVVVAGGVPVYGGRRLTGLALDQVLTGVGDVGTVVAFCR